MRYLTLIAILALFCFGCVTTDQPSPTQQEAAQTSDRIGPMDTAPVRVNVNINPAAGDTDHPVVVGDVTVTVTTSNTQQGSTEQSSEQGQERGDVDSTATNTPTVETELPISLTP